MLTPCFNRPLASAFAQISDLVMYVTPFRQCCKDTCLILSHQSTALDRNHKVPQKMQKAVDSLRLWPTLTKV